MGGNAKTLAKVIGYILVVLILAVAVGAVYRFTNGFNESFKTFYIQYNGSDILTETSRMSLTVGKAHRFDVYYTFDTDDAEPKGYNVEIQTNVSRDFDFTVDGENYIFSKVGDVTEGFEINKSDTYFELVLDEDISLSSVLEAVYGSDNVVLPNDAEENNPYPFKLLISSYNEGVVYEINFEFNDEGLYEIESKLINGPAGFNLSVLNLPEREFFGETVKFNVSLNTRDYMLSDVSVETEDGTDIPVENIGDEYSFVMPESKVFILITVEETTPEYTIKTMIVGGATNLTAVSYNIPSTALAGERVEFTVTVEDAAYTLTEVSISSHMVSDDIPVQYSNGIYSFTMPEGDITISINLEYSIEDTYSISYDMLGWGSFSSLDIDAPAYAAAGENVSFTASIIASQAADYKISRVSIVSADSGEDIYGELTANGNTYTFVMPEEEVVIMVYIIPIDM